MLTKLKILFALIAVALFNGMALAASFTATLDRDTITLGEQATLSLAFEGGQPQNMAPLPSIRNLLVEDDNSWSQNIRMDMGSGQSSAIFTHTLILKPQTTGEFLIPSISVDVGGQHLSSSPLKLTVTAASAPSAAAVNSGNEVAFLKLVFPKQKIYVGESAVVRLELYLRDDVQNFGNFQITGSPTDGFSAGKLTELHNQRRRVQVGNHVYTMIPLDMPLTAVRAGPLTLGPFTGSAVVVLPSQNDNGDPFFRQFFNQGEQKQVTLATEPVNVESLPLPEANKPVNFTGAVGNFTMTTTDGPTTLTVGDPITVRVQISGRGDLGAVTLPAQDAWRDFKTYPPTTKLETTDPFGFQGTKTFEQIISPMNADVHEIPPLNFSYFDPKDGKYHALAHAAVPLVVKAAAALPMPVIAANRNAAPENQTPQDILPIKENLGTTEMKSVLLVARPAFLTLQTLPVLAFLAAFVWRKRADSLANNPRLRRKIAVEKLVQNGVGDLKKFTVENKSEEFFALLFRLLQEQLGERLDCPATAITENVVEENSILRGANENTRNGLRDLFQLCNQAHYAPVRGTAELNSVAAQFEKVIGELQEVKA